MERRRRSRRRAPGADASLIEPTSPSSASTRGSTRGRPTTRSSLPSPPPENRRGSWESSREPRPFSFRSTRTGRTFRVRRERRTPHRRLKPAATTTRSLADYAKTGECSEMHGNGGIIRCARATCTAFRRNLSILQQEPTTQPTAEPAGGDPRRALSFQTFAAPVRMGGHRRVGTMESTVDALAPPWSPFCRSLGQKATYGMRSPTTTGPVTPRSETFATQVKTYEFLSLSEKIQQECQKSPQRINMAMGI